jgi:hypothetical protein
MSLTLVSAYFKRAVVYLGIFVVVYYLLILVIAPETKKAFKRIFTRPVPANPIYGTLDPLEFIEKPITQQAPRYVLNTPSGKLPEDMPIIVPVYKFKPRPFSYLAGTNAISDAAKLGFSQNDMVSDLKGKVYRWRSLRSNGILEIKIETRELNLFTNINGRTVEYPYGTVNQDVAKRVAESMFRSINRFDDGLYPTGTSVVHLGNISNSGIYEARNTRESQVAMVDFFRSIDGYPILGPDARKGMLRAVVKDPTTDSPFNYPTVTANYWEINPDSSATYPIITVEEAWNAISSGRGVVSSVAPKNVNVFLPYIPVRVESILVDNIYLAYYDHPQLQTYLQPIYVFDGKYTTKGTEGGEITLYFPAVTKDFVKQPQNTTNPTSEPATTR